MFKTFIIKFHIRIMTKKELEIKLSELEDNFVTLKKYTEYISTKLEQNMIFTNYLADNINEALNYIEFVNSHSYKMTWDEFKVFSKLPENEFVKKVREFKIDNLI